MLASQAPQPIQPTPSVAIIGGGIGGAFAAWWLRNASPAVRIDVYERSSAVGGRTLDTGEGDASVELGASMAIVQNRYVAEAATALGLSRQLHVMISVRVLRSPLPFVQLPHKMC